MRKTVFSLCFLMVTSFSVAQIQKKKIGNDFSRWSLGVNGGISAFRGDMISFSADKTYIGVQGGLQLGYQFTPTFGLSLTADMGQGKGSAKKWEKAFKIYPNGESYYGTEPEAGFAYYNDIYAKIKYFTLGLHGDFNVNNFFGKKELRRWTVLLSPAVYLQKFSPKLYKKEDDKRFDTSSTLDNDVNLGLGGDIALRYRASKYIDLQLTSGVAWIANNNFDGVATCCTSKYNWLANLSVGVMWKIGNNKKKENLMYATARSVAPVILPVKEETRSVVKEEQKPVVKQEEKTVENVVKVETTEKTFPVLPTVHFKRNSAVIDTDRYASELSRIVEALKEFPGVKVDIRGYTDHTGTDRINLPLSLKRAEALKTYLVSKGIPADRMSTFGEGKDMSVDQKDIYTEKARKVEVKKH
ncbi:OmpA family protein [Butyricimonas faecihominis]|uniref:OmpA family protein n=1 Tax=Butyricimonas faecihominis TaxID=1472416 RepID=UPI00267073F1|nr:OmpA family protein [Butyricimonas faecihominis]